MKHEFQTYNNMQVGGLCADYIMGCLFLSPLQCLPAAMLNSRFMHRIRSESAAGSS